MKIGRTTEREQRQPPFERQHRDQRRHQHDDVAHHAAERAGDRRLGADDVVVETAGDRAGRRACEERQRQPLHLGVQRPPQVGDQTFADAGAAPSLPDLQHRVARARQRRRSRPATRSAERSPARDGVRRGSGARRAAARVPAGRRSGSATGTRRSCPGTGGRTPHTRRGRARGRAAFPSPRRRPAASCVGPMRTSAGYGDGDVGVPLDGAMAWPAVRLPRCRPRSTGPGRSCVVSRRRADRSACTASSTAIDRRSAARPASRHPTPTRPDSADRHPRPTSHRPASRLPVRRSTPSSRPAADRVGSSSTTASTSGRSTVPVDYADPERPAVRTVPGAASSARSRTTDRHAARQSRWTRLRAAVDYAVAAPRSSTRAARTVRHRRLGPARHRRGDPRRSIASTTTTRTSPPSTHARVRRRAAALVGIAAGVRRSVPRAQRRRHRARRHEQLAPATWTRSAGRSARTQISYFGFSYGSELGATWATLFPDTVRAAVFDGAADPNADASSRRSCKQSPGSSSRSTVPRSSAATTPGCAFHNDGDAAGGVRRPAGESLDATPLEAIPIARPSTATWRRPRSSRRCTPTRYWPALDAARSPAPSRRRQRAARAARRLLPAASPTAPTATSSRRSR